MNTYFSHTFDDEIKVSHKIDNSIENTDQYKEHCHPYYEILFFLEGNVEYVVENRKFRLTPCSGIISRPSQYHYPTFLKNETYERYVIKFYDNVISDNLKQQLESTGNFFTVKDKNTINLFSKLDYYQERYSGENLKDLYRSVINEIVIEIINDIVSSPKQIINEKMSEILDYINSNLSDDITLKSLSEKFYQSRTWIYNSFMESVNVSPMKYVESKRIAYANKLISSGMKPTKIYEMCGYHEYSSFYRAFKSVSNCMPSKK